MRTRKHWSALPPIPGFIRIPDQNGARYAECDICHLHLPSLGVGDRKSVV